MFSAFKISYDPEVTSLIEKHGVNDALFIKNVGYFVNNPLEEVGDEGCTTMSTGVLKVVSGLKNPIGLTSTEWCILAFWGDQLGSKTVAFLTKHAHTILKARGRTGPYSKYDLNYISWTVKAMKQEVATTDTTMAELCTNYGDIFDVESEMRTEEGMKRLLTGSVEPPRDYTAGRERTAARADVSDPLFFKDEDMDKMTDPELLSTLAGVDLAISRIDAWKERLKREKDRIHDDTEALHLKRDFAKDRLKSLKEKRGYLKSLKR
ncbi:uncharacterized protein FMAN_12156 [Fusarium mangiferae]|uniref:Uncharacterized protein n=1 Tax=Fusarium mangiferae TaxID=192010 RepID=A0A1L7TJF0_FUSMA|nr:uncharacterized protein FMAN_12156 [Fusarium mangiferae]CVK98019.1 uncharacterized protein FMAN_12156 [Fusarium mangiferae]